jgi:hypothetical protein
VKPLCVIVKIAETSADCGRGAPTEQCEIACETRHTDHIGKFHEISTFFLIGKFHYEFHEILSLANQRSEVGREARRSGRYRDLRGWCTSCIPVNRPFELCRIFPKVHYPDVFRLTDLLSFVEFPPKYTIRMVYVRIRYPGIYRSQSLVLISSFQDIALDAHVRS